MPSKKNSKKSPTENGRTGFLHQLVGEGQDRLEDLFDAVASSGLESLVRDLSSDKVMERVTSLLRQFSEIDKDTLNGFRYIIQATFEAYRENLKKRQRGEYEVDEFGLDEDFHDLVRPFFSFLYKKWWRVETSGLENVPSDGPALLVANHSGVLPWDGAMIATAVLTEAKVPRITRTLYLDMFTKMAFVHPLLTRTGQVFACPENAERLLKKGNLTCVFPEGLKGVGKLFKDRYQLARFGRGGFVKSAIRGRAPIIPVSVVGAEEIYPTIMRADIIGKPLGSPMFPITPFFPWLGLLGMVPLPSKWAIHFGKPIRTDEYEPRQANNFLVVQKVTNQVRDEIQGTVKKMVRKRGPAFA